MVNHYGKRGEGAIYSYSWGQECSTHNTQSLVPARNSVPPLLQIANAGPLFTCLGFQYLSPNASCWKTTPLVHDPILCGRAGDGAGAGAASTAGRAGATANFLKTGLCFVLNLSLMMALSKSGVPLPKRLHSLPSFALSSSWPLSLCFHLFGLLYDSRNKNKILWLGMRGLF